MTGVSYVLLQQICTDNDVLLQQICTDNDGCNLRFTTTDMYW